MPHFRLLIAFATLVSISSFLFLNIQQMGAGRGYALIAISVVLSVIVLLASRKLRAQISFRYPHLFILFFISYFLGNLIITSLDFNIVRANSVGTDSGVIFFTVLGLLVSMALSSLINMQSDPRSKSLVNYGTLIFILSSVIWQLLIFENYHSSIRDDLFLIANDGGLYQRPANFMLMQGLICSSLVISTSVYNQQKDRMISLASASGCGVFLLLAALTAQIIGSNSGLVSSLCLLILLVGVTYVSFDQKFVHGLRRVSLRGLLVGWLGLKVLKFTAASAVVGIILIILALRYFNVDPKQFRIFGFGSGEITSINSRIEILTSNFEVHFAYSPVFGNAMVDTITTGEGSYVHSLLSILTHLGIVGAILFALFVTSMFKEFGTSRNTLTPPFPTYHAYKLLRVLCLLMVLFLALISTFFTWAPLWFSFGMISLGFRPSWR
jgi:hypothetical protein